MDLLHAKQFDKETEAWRSFLGLGQMPKRISFSRNAKFVENENGKLAEVPSPLKNIKPINKKKKANCTKKK